MTSSASPGSAAAPNPPDSLAAPNSSSSNDSATLASGSPTSAASFAEVSERLRGRRPSEAEFVRNARRWVAALFLTLGVVTMAGTTSSTEVFANVTYVYVLFGLNLVVVLTTLVLRITPYWLFLAVVIASAVASVWMSIPTTPSGEFPLSAQWLLHSCAAAGLLLSTRLAALVIFPTMLFSLGAMIAHLGMDQPWSSTAAVLIITIDAVAISMGVNAGVTTWQRYAQRRDIAVDVALDASAAVERAEQRAHDRYLLRIHLHDTILNFFRGIRIAGDSSNAARTRALECLEQLDRAAIPAASEELSAERLATDVADEAALIGLSIEIRFERSDAAAVAIPSRVFFGLKACIRAALLNVQAHSGAATAQVRIAEGSTGIRVSVIDDGSGFVVGSVGPLSVQRRAEHFGIDATVISQDGAGTRVDLSWPTKLESTGDNKFPDGYVDWMNGSLTVLARRVVVWLATGYLLQSILLPGIGLFSTAMIGLFIFVGVLVVTFSRRRPWPLPWAGTAAIVVAIPVVASLVKASYGLCTAEAETFIGSSLAVVLALTGILLGRGKVQALLPLVAYVLTNGAFSFVALSESADCGSAVFGNYVTDVAALFALFMVRQMFIRFAREMQLSHEIELESVGAEQLASARSLQASGRLALAMGQSWSIVEGIGDGSLDPSSPDVMEQIAIEERFLRNLLTIDSQELGVLAQPLRDLATTAHERGINLYFGVTGLPWRDGMAPDSAVAARIARFLEPLLDQMPAGQASRITVMPTQPVPIRVMIPATAMISFVPPAAPLVVESHFDDDQFDLELTWPQSP